MGGTGDESAINAMSDAIKLKGGEIINSFAIRTGGVKNEKIIEEGNQIGKQYKN